jgi:hypothetical protein
MTLTTADLTAAGSRGVGAVTAGPARPGHAVRRVFTSAYKLRIIQEHDGLTEHGAKGALLRREGKGGPTLLAVLLEVVPSPLEGDMRAHQAVECLQQAHSSRQIRTDPTISGGDAE